jgi:hypothetical protein
MKCLRCGNHIIKDGKLLTDAHTLRYDICKCDVKKMYEFIAMVATKPKHFEHVITEAQKLRKEIDKNLKGRNSRDVNG